MPWLLSPMDDVDKIKPGNNPLLSHMELTKRSAISSKNAQTQNLKVVCGNCTKLGRKQ